VYKILNIGCLSNQTSFFEDEEDGRDPQGFGYPKSGSSSNEIDENVILFCFLSTTMIPNVSNMLQYLPQVPTLCFPSFFNQKSYYLFIKTEKRNSTKRKKKYT
jgi:hypothetical protein